MPRFAVPPVLVSRRAALALLAGGLLPRPTPVRGSHGGNHTPYALTITGSLLGVAPFHLHLRRNADGGAQAHGTLHLPEVDPPEVLVMTGEAGVDFANGAIAGLTVELRPPAPLDPNRPGDLALLRISVPGASIAASGIYEVEIALTGGGTTIEEHAIQIAVRYLEPGGAAAREERLAAQAADNAAIKRKRRAAGGRGRRGKRRR